MAVEWSSDIGYALDDWQKWLVRWTFARQPDGLWAARDMGVEVPRQNGKNIWLEVVELAGIVLFGEMEIVHSAHRADTSADHFKSLRRRIEGSEELWALMPKRANHGFIKSHGMESIEFDNGGVISFKARENSSGRGIRPQRIVFDEALVLEESQVGSMAPGITAQANPQLLYASSPPRANSSVLHSLRGRAQNPDPEDRLFYAAWNNERGTSVNDRDGWYRVNPSLGFGRMTEASLNANKFTMSAAEYAREHIGIPEPAPTAGSVWEAGKWAAVLSPDAAPSAPFFLGVDANPERTQFAVAVAGGGVVEVVDPRPTSANLLPLLARLHERFGAPVAFDPSGPVGWLKPELERLAVPMLEVSGVRMGQACGAFFTAVNDGVIRVRPSADLSTAVAGARTQPRSDAWVWARKDGSVDVSPLVAVTLAWWAASQAVSVPKPSFVY